ncbi:MAG: hypothetical protein IKT40_12400 [Bacilli bacterium]|nr:hypothetical protein [Bacilli bacterium]
MLLQDLCGRLPYDVRIHVNDRVETLQGLNILDNVAEYGSFLCCDIEDVKPYLFPMSSMTEEQTKEYQRLFSLRVFPNFHIMDWLNKNHFDYQGLIRKSLAIDATRLNIY